MPYKAIIGGLVLCVLLLSACNMQLQQAGAEISLETATEVVMTATPISSATVTTIQQPPAAASPVASIPIVGSAIIVETVCAVVATSGQATIWGDGGTPLAYLHGKIALDETADNAFIVTVSPGVEGWVSAMEAHLEGTTCPDFMSVPNVPPPVGYPGTPTAAELASGCYVVRSPGGGGYISVYYGAADAYAAIAVLDGYAEFVMAWDGGYEISVPQYERNLWVRGGVHLEGTGCP